MMHWIASASRQAALGDLDYDAQSEAISGADWHIEYMSDARADRVRQVQDAGATCAVAPGMNPLVLQAAIEAQLPFAPGVATPSEIEQALEFDCDILKFFPSEPMGGLKYLKSMQAPYAHLDLQFIPLGGLTAENAEDYLREDIILAVGGSWIANASAINSGDWEGITQRAKAVMQQSELESNTN